MPFVSDSPCQKYTTFICSLVFLIVFTLYSPLLLLRKQIDVSRFSGEMRGEWEGFREHDVVFLVCIERPQPDAVARLVEYEREHKNSSSFSSAGKANRNNGGGGTEEDEEMLDFAKLFGTFCFAIFLLLTIFISDQFSNSHCNLSGVKYVRGGELFELRDEANVVLNDPSR